jgi:uncharacterized protein YacL
MSSRVIRGIIGLLAGAAVAIGVYENLIATPPKLLRDFPLGAIIGIAVVSGLISAIIVIYISLVPYRWVRDEIRHAQVSDLIAGVIGLFVGLSIAALANIFLSQIRFLELGQWLPILAALLFAYIGIAIAVLRKDDFAWLFSSAWAAGRARRSAREERESEDHEEHGRLRDRLAPRRGVSRSSDRILVDTSAIIDGRIADISQTGFITGTLVVPRFVLEELQRIADSSDTMRRNRGRRGLEILQRLQRDEFVNIEISDADVENIHEVDGKLVKLARQWRCPIITNDFNLNRVAELQGVKVLNINELAHAVKPILLPGEEMNIKIMQDGKESGQGVGYLDDGTMIVVEGGKQHMGRTIDVTVTRVLQTVAGRMIFAHPKEATNGATPARRTGTA